MNANHNLRNEKSDEIEKENDSSTQIRPAKPSKGVGKSTIKEKWKKRKEYQFQYKVTQRYGFLPLLAITTHPLFCINLKYLYTFSLIKQVAVFITLLGISVLLLFASIIVTLFVRSFIVYAESLRRILEPFCMLQCYRLVQLDRGVSWRKFSFFRFLSRVSTFIQNHIILLERQFL